PFFVIVTWQKMLRCVPAALFGCVVMLKANSFASLVNATSEAAVFAGRPMSFTAALPSNGVVVVTLQNICVGLPCSVAARSIAICTNGAAISSVNSCDETHIGPLPASAVATSAVFHLRTGAPPFALTSKKPSVCPSGIVMAVDDPTPGGL